mgnify:FL=1
MSAGYKEQCLIEDHAVAMWSFDGDTFEGASGVPLLDYLIDEVDNQNKAWVMADSSGQTPLIIGRPSLVELEPSNQYSLAQGLDAPPAGSAPWPKWYLSVDHSADFNFPNLGSFSVEFVAKKDNENVYGASTGSGFWSKTTPLNRKTEEFDKTST